jgi:hypothetical protein
MPLHGWVTAVCVALAVVARTSEDADVPRARCLAGVLEGIARCNQLPSTSAARLREAVVEGTSFPVFRTPESHASAEFDHFLHTIWTERNHMQWYQLNTTREHKLVPALSHAPFKAIFLPER